MKRLGEFLRSVIPADPAQLIYLAGLVCLTICVRVRWEPLGSVFGMDDQLSDLGITKNERLQTLRYFLVGGKGLVKLAVISGYFNCFFPGKRPALRILLSVILPTVIAIAIISVFYLHSSPAAYKSILDSLPQASLWQLGPGFRICVLGLGLILAFLSRMAFRIANLPISLSASVNEESIEDSTWRKTGLLIWILISPILMILTTFPMEAWSRASGAKTSLEIYALIAFSSVFPAFILIGLASLVVGNEGWIEMRQSLSIARFRYIVPALAFPLGIAGLLIIINFAYERIQWAAHDFGRIESPNLWMPSHLPRPWFLLWFLAALAEEIIFRGLLQKRFIRRYGVMRGIFLVSICWSAFHFGSDSYDSSSYVAILVALGWRIALCLALGFIFSWITIRSGSVLYAALAHAIHNTLVFSNFGAMFAWREAVRAILMAALAFVLYRYWPIREEEPSPEVLAPIEPVPVV